MVNYNNLVLHRCSKEDLATILQFQDDIIASLDNKALLRKNTEEMFLSCLQKPNLTLGLYDNDQLVALTILVDARNTEEDLAIGLEKYQVNINANYKLQLVKKEYRGNKFMSALMRIINRYAIQNGYTHLCATVSPDNPFSYNNLLKDNYKLDHQAIKYGGLIRNVYVKELVKDYQYTSELTNCFSSYDEPFIDGSILITNDNKKIIWHYGDQIPDYIKVYIPTF